MTTLRALVRHRKRQRLLNAWRRFLKSGGLGEPVYQPHYSQWWT